MYTIFCNSHNSESFTQYIMCSLDPRNIYNLCPESSETEFTAEKPGISGQFRLKL